MNITFQIGIGILQLLMKLGWSRQESSCRPVVFQYHYHPAWYTAWSEQLSEGTLSTRWSRPSSQHCTGICLSCCSSSEIWGRRCDRPAESHHTTREVWTLWTTTTSPSCLVSEPSIWGTLDIWTRWIELCEALPSSLILWSCCHVTTTVIGQYHSQNLVLFWSMISGQWDGVSDLTLSCDEWCQSWELSPVLLWERGEQGELVPSFTVRLQCSDLGRVNIDWAEYAARVTVNR